MLNNSFIPLKQGFWFSASLVNIYAIVSELSRNKSYTDLWLHGTLADGTTVAVKKLSSKSSQGNREFLNEIGIISALRHPNLVRLFGCCIDGDQLLLIYEFLENNSLGRALFGKPS
jgi:serine/threonine protein kinase